MGNPWLFLRMICQWWIPHIYASLLAGRWWSVVAWWLRLSGYVLVGFLQFLASQNWLLLLSHSSHTLKMVWVKIEGPWVLFFFGYAYNRLNMYQPSKLRVRGYPILSWKRLSNSLVVQGPRCFAAFARLGCRISPVDAFFPGRFGPIFLWWQMNDVMSKTGSVPARLKRSTSHSVHGHAQGLPWCLCIIFIDVWTILFELSRDMFHKFPKR